MDGLAKGRSRKMRKLFRIGCTKPQTNSATVSFGSLKEDPIIPNQSTVGYSQLLDSDKPQEIHFYLQLKHQYHLQIAKKLEACSLKIPALMSFEEAQQNRLEQIREDQYFQEQIRGEALIRKTNYEASYTNIFEHEPINEKQSRELHEQLKSSYMPRIEEVRKHHDPEQVNKQYSKIYEEFIKLTTKNQYEERKVTSDIQEMHEMADLLLHPPDMFNANDLFLYSKQAPTQTEKNELDSIFRKYQYAYEAGEKVEESNAEDTIRRAKQYILHKYA